MAWWIWGGGGGYFTKRELQVQVVREVIDRAVRVGGGDVGYFYCIFI